MARHRHTPPPGWKNPLAPQQPLASARWILAALGGTLLLALLCVYAAFCLLFWQGQWQLVFRPSRTITATPTSFAKLFHEAGESTVITLTGLDGQKQALIHDVNFDAVSGEPMHADFYAIEKGQTVTVSVPLEFDGVSPAVKDLGGILTKVMHELEIEVEATELPQAIHIDVSALKTLDDQIKVSDLKLPKSAKLSVDADEVVAMISVAQDEPVESAPMDITQIETSVERGKKEEEAPAEGETKE